jgi:hypothetical protein
MVNPNSTGVLYETRPITGRCNVSESSILEFKVLQLQAIMMQLSMHNDVYGATFNYVLSNPSNVEST